jgi:methylmalonyl-CoA mutase
LKKQQEKQARIDSGQDIIVGVNKYRLERRSLSHSRCGQPNGSQTAMEQLDRIKASRIPKSTELQKLIDCAKTGGNLLEIAVDAARNRTIG